MESTSMRSGAAGLAWLRGVDWGGVATWLFGFGLVAYLGLEGGGYDPIVHDRVGIAIWWVLLVGVSIGALPRRRVGVLAWSALGLLAAFVAWTALGMSWTESAEKTFADLARVSGYLGIFALALFLRGTDGARRLASAVATAIVLVAIVALLSRLHPAWFPDASQTAQFLGGNEERLSYPLNYWNGLAALIAVGIPVVLHFAVGAGTVAFRALAAAALPAMVLASFLTFSRAGIGAAAIAVAVFFVFASDRLPKLLTLLVAGVGGAILCRAADARSDLADGLLGATAEAQGDEVLAMTLLVCFGVGAIQVAVSLAMDEARRPRWLYVPRRHSLVFTTVAVVGAAIAVLALGGPGRASDAWDEFKQADSPGEGSGRLFSAAGQNRYQYWSSAADQNATEPLTGTGSGTFEYWWARHRPSADAVRDTHSLYMQTFGELGIVGLALLAAFLGAILIGGGREVVRAGARERSLPAAALAGCLAFCLTAAVDWVWQIPVLPAALLLLAAVLLTAPARSDRDGTAGLGWPLRLAFGGVAIAAIVAIAIPLATVDLLRQSEADVRAGDPSGALAAARSAQNVQPGAATPRLQQALVLEELGDFGAAAEAARAATERGETDWRAWLVLSRVEAQRGRVAAAVRAYRRARSLNPHSPLFDR